MGLNNFISKWGGLNKRVSRTNTQKKVFYETKH